MKSLEEAKHLLRESFAFEFEYAGKDGDVDFCTNRESGKDNYHIRYGTDNYDLSTEDEVFTFPFIDGKSLSEIYADVEIQPC
mgnify:FL=1